MTHRLFPHGQGRLWRRPVVRWRQSPLGKMLTRLLLNGAGVVAWAWLIVHVSPWIWLGLPLAGLSCLAFLDAGIALVTRLYDDEAP